jgi:hypothetical protein
MYYVEVCLLYNANQCRTFLLINIYSLFFFSIFFLLKSDCFIKRRKLDGPSHTKVDRPIPISVVDYVATVESRKVEFRQGWTRMLGILQSNSKLLTVFEGLPWANAYCIHAFCGASRTLEALIKVKYGGWSMKKCAKQTTWKRLYNIWAQHYCTTYREHKHFYFHKYKSEHYMQLRFQTEK